MGNLNCANNTGCYTCAEGNTPNSSTEPGGAIGGGDQQRPSYTNPGYQRQSYKEVDLRVTHKGRNNGQQYAGNEFYMSGANPQGLESPQMHNSQRQYDELRMSNQSCRREKRPPVTLPSGGVYTGEWIENLRDGFGT